MGKISDDVEDRVFKAWGEYDFSGADFIVRNIKQGSKNHYSIWIDYEIFEPSEYKIRVDSRKNFNTDVKKFCKDMRRSFEKHNFKVTTFGYTHSPFEAGSTTDVQFDISFEDIKDEKLKKKIGKFKDFLDV